MSPDGMYHSGSTAASANFRCDGKGYQTKNGLTAFCSQASSSELEITSFRNSSKVVTVHWKLSPDGKALTIKTTTFYPDGSLNLKAFRYMRTSASVGFAGKWRNLNPIDGLAAIMQVNMGSNAVHYAIPEREIHVDAFLDGTDAAIQSPLVSPGETIALRERGPRELTSVMKRNARVVSVGYWQLSDDGHLLTASYWLPNNPSEKDVLVYEKQQKTGGRDPDNVVKPPE